MEQMNSSMNTGIAASHSITELNFISNPIECFTTERNNHSLKNKLVIQRSI